MGFQLHPRLAADTVELCRWDLCRILLMNDATYPWLIMVPQRAETREIHELSEGEAATLMGEIARASRALEQAVSAHKMNVAALGNLVPQLHVHVVARFEGDPAWPGPIWGVAPPQPYETGALAERMAALLPLLSASDDLAKSAGSA